MEELPPATLSTDYHKDGEGVPAYTAEQVRELMMQAKADERERCAVLAENMPIESEPQDYAAAIRA